MLCSNGSLRGEFLQAPNQIAIAVFFTDGYGDTYSTDPLA
jgi:hypothetical protein